MAEGEKKYDEQVRIRGDIAETWKSNGKVSPYHNRGNNDYNAARAQVCFMQPSASIHHCPPRMLNDCVRSPRV